MLTPTKFLSIVATLLVMTQFANAEIVLKTDEAKKWEAENAANALVKLQDQGNRASELKENGYSISVEKKVVVLRVGWDHEGVSSKEPATRDNMAAQALFAQGDKLIAEWNKKFGITKKTFGGVVFIRTEGGWSDTEGPSAGNGFKRKYKAGGTAVGYILVDP